MAVANRLKKIKAAGPAAAHLFGGGDVITGGLTGILNAMVDLKAVPTSVKCRLVMKVWKVPNEGGHIATKV